MRANSVALSSVLASTAIALFTGCSASIPSVYQTPASPTDLPQTWPSFIRKPLSAGFTEQSISPMQFDSGGRASTESPTRRFKLLAVTDFSNNDVKILNAHYKVLRTITNGINGPAFDWYDAQGNLYVAQTGAANVVEYAKGGSSPVFTYSSGLTGPSDVTTDGSGNVYVADFGCRRCSPSVVNEYAQLSNYAIASCSTGLHNEGIAIDKNGDVFVSATDFNSSFTTAHIIEYKGGLSGCNGTTLGVALIYAGGLQIDKSGNLVAVDQSVGSVAAVDIIPPPYNSISYQILQNQNCGGAGIALNPRQNKLFVANPGCTVSIFTYPGGRLVRTLGPSYGFTSPVGVAVFP